MLLNGRVVSATEAKAAGFVSEVCHHDSLEKNILPLLKQLTTKSVEVSEVQLAPLFEGIALTADFGTRDDVLLRSDTRRIWLRGERRACRETSDMCHIIGAFRCEIS